MAQQQNINDNYQKDMADGTAQKDAYKYQDKWKMTTTTTTQDMDVYRRKHKTRQETNKAENDTG
jgi:hypothetical protein